MIDGAVSRRRGTKSRSRKRATAQEEGVMATRTSAASNEPLRTGMAFASEVVIPGGSNLLSGNYKQGLIHMGLGLVAGALFGLPGAIVVAANSFTRSTTGHHLYEALPSLGTDEKS